MHVADQRKYNYYRVGRVFHSGQQAIVNYDKPTLRYDGLNLLQNFASRNVFAMYLANESTRKTVITFSSSLLFITRI